MLRAKEDEKLASRDANLSPGGKVAKGSREPFGKSANPGGDAITEAPSGAAGNFDEKLAPCGANKSPGKVAKASREAFGNPGQAKRRGNIKSIT